ncbi:MAG TPA: type II secretion system protein [Pyrinomonadaceae bacterium]|jgi:prepilin-type N-terminal cleavage/methylation domain-containing protein
MKSHSKKTSLGFSLLELLIAMTVMLIALSIVSSLLARAWSVRARESRTSDALATAQAAIDVLSREISNSGFGLVDDTSSQLPASNGLVLADCTANKVRFRSNIENEGGTEVSPGPTAESINRPGEDVTYFFDSATQSIVRYDPFGFTLDSVTYQPLTSVVVNKISNVTFQYYNYAGSTSASTLVATPTNDTGRVRLTVEVQLEQVVGQVNPQKVTFSSDVTLRNNTYMLKQY